jgi:hypothetical protein
MSTSKSPRNKRQNSAASWETTPAERAKHRGVQVRTRVRYVALLRTYAAVNCCKLSSEVRFSFFHFPKEAGRYRKTAIKIQGISKIMFSHGISVLLSPSDISSVIGDNGSPISIKHVQRYL